ncbi:hypothetical protein EGW08_001234, partial [Elysia chlorotica]
LSVTLVFGWRTGANGEVFGSRSGGLRFSKLTIAQHIFRFRPLIISRTMRMYLKRALQWVLAIVLIQVVVYFWAVNRKGNQQKQLKQPRRTQVEPHPYVQSTRNRTDGTCSYDTCPKIEKGVLNVHLVPHSHIDVGWLKSVDEYYTGEGDGDHGNTLYAGCVRCILNNTLQELVKNPSRTFIFAEMKYFSRFWHEASMAEKNTIRQLIKERRLEIVNGGWVMSDAGVTVYNDIIDQHTLGFDFIRETLGPCAQTRTGWHVDQFGHSSEHASIFAQMGYDSLFIGRISDSDKEKKKLARELEMVWLTSDKNLGERSALFTHVTYDGYYAPHGYVLENLNENAFVSERFILFELRNKLISSQAAAFKTRHLLVPMGSDFGYRRPDLWFKNMDEAIAQVYYPHSLNVGRKRKDVNLIYSTPSCYAYYVNEDMKAPALFPTKKDDFLPYVTDVVWSGFYTTRGGFKRHIWTAGQILQSCKQLSIFSALPGTFKRINVLRECIFFFSILMKKIKLLEYRYSQYFILLKNCPTMLIPFSPLLFCLNSCYCANKTECLESKKINYKNKTTIVSSKVVLLFYTHVKQLLNLTFDQTGLLVSMTNKASGVQVSISQDFAAYEPNMAERNEGAYVFVPGTEPAQPVRSNKPVDIKVIKGDLVQEVHQTFTKSVTQVVRLYSTSKFAEFHWTVGKLTIRHSSGIDIVSVFSSSVSNGELFYTDSNGREMIERRYDWEMSPSYKISGNYFPVTSRMFIKDDAKNIQLTLLPDRPQGGSSLQQGSMELMVHRRSVTDDGLGMQEPLNDVGSDNEGIIYTGKHYLYLDTIENSGLPVRRKAWETQLEPTVMFTEVKRDKEINNSLAQVSFLNPGVMPDNVHLLTLDHIVESDSTLLLIRLEHALEKEKSNGNSQEAVVELEKLFTPFDIVSVEETTLGGNFNPKEVERLEWVSEKVVAPKFVGFPDFQSQMEPPFRVTLSSMAIRTFRIKIIYNKD